MDVGEEQLRVAIKDTPHEKEEFLMRTLNAIVLLSLLAVCIFTADTAKKNIELAENSPYSVAPDTSDLSSEQIFYFSLSPTQNISSFLLTLSADSAADYPSSSSDSDQSSSSSSSSSATVFKAHLLLSLQPHPNFQRYVAYDNYTSSRGISGVAGISVSPNNIVTLTPGVTYYATVVLQQSVGASLLWQTESHLSAPTAPDNCHIQMLEGFDGIEFSVDYASNDALLNGISYSAYLSPLGVGQDIIGANVATATGTSENSKFYKAMSMGGAGYAATFDREISQGTVYVINAVASIQDPATGFTLSTPYCALVFEAGQTASADLLSLLMILFWGIVVCVGCLCCVCILLVATIAPCVCVFGILICCLCNRRKNPYAYTQVQYQPYGTPTNFATPLPSMPMESHPNHSNLNHSENENTTMTKSYEAATQYGTVNGPN